MNELYYGKPKKTWKLRYVGESFGAVSLTNGKIYEAWKDPDSGMCRVIDDSGQDYLYDWDNPAPLDGSSPGGRWEVVESGLMNKLEEMLDMIERFLKGDYNSLTFSEEAPYFLYENYDKIEMTNPTVCSYLLDNLPDICKNYNQKDTTEDVQGKIRVVYEKIQTMI